MTRAVQQIRRMATTPPAVIKYTVSMIIIGGGKAGGGGATGDGGGVDGTGGDGGLGAPGGDEGGRGGGLGGAMHRELKASPHMHTCHVAPREVRRRGQTKGGEEERASPHMHTPLKQCSVFSQSMPVHADGLQINSRCCGQLMAPEVAPGLVICAPGDVHACHSLVPDCTLSSTSRVPPMQRVL